MLKNISIQTNDTVWQEILSDLHADINKNAKIFWQSPNKRINLSEILNLMEALENKHLQQIGAIGLSETENKLIMLLPGTATELKSKMGYAESANTHTIETIIYNIRKKLGADFIKLKSGKYVL